MANILNTRFMRNYYTSHPHMGGGGGGEEGPGITRVVVRIVCNVGLSVYTTLLFSTYNASNESIEDGSAPAGPKKRETRTTSMVGCVRSFKIPHNF